MALNNKNQNSNIDAVKTTFFDLFADHIGELAKMIEILAKNEANDPFETERAIFQRIILLNKTVNNIKSLSENVDDLNNAKDRNLLKPVKAVSNTASAEITPNQETTENKIVAKPIAQTTAINNSQAPFSKSMTSTPSIASTLESTLNSIPSTPTNNVPVPSQPPKTINKEPAPSQTTTPNVPTTSQTTSSTNNVIMPNPIPESNTIKTPAIIQSPSQPVTNNSTIIPESTTADNVINSANNKNGLPNNRPLKFIKNSKNKVKAILVNERQYQRLKASFKRQAESLDFGANSEMDVESSRKKIEELMKKASALYKEGKVSEAQALYAEISSLNKKLNQTQGRENVLIKKKTA